jgi:hypothetical protein
VDGSLVDDAQRLVDRLAARLRQSVAVDDPDGNLIVVSRHFGDADAYRVRLMLDRRIPREYREYFTSYTRDATTSPVRIPANPQLSLAARICFPIRDDTEIVAFLWLLDLDKGLPQELIEQYCARLADVLSARRGREGFAARALALQEPIRKLLAGHRPTDVLPEAGAESALAQRRYIAITHYSEAGPELDIARSFRHVASATADLGVTLACAADLHGCSVGIFESEPSERTTEVHIRDWLLDETRRALGDHPARAGCGISAAGELAEVRQLFARASQAAFICLHLYRAESVLSWEQVQPLASLIAGDVPGPDSGRTAALTALLLDPDNFAFDTIGAVLRSGRDQSPADILHVHRTTLHYRLQQIVELTGLDLAVPTDRFLAISVWLRVALSISPLAGLVKSS